MKVLSSSTKRQRSRLQSKFEKGNANVCVTESLKAKQRRKALNIKYTILTFHDIGWKMQWWKNLATGTKTNFYQHMQKDVFEQPQYLTLQQQVKNNSQKNKKKGSNDCMIHCYANYL